MAAEARRDTGQTGKGEVNVYKAFKKFLDIVSGDGTVVTEVMAEALLREKPVSVNSTGDSHTVVEPSKT